MALPVHKVTERERRGALLLDCARIARPPASNAETNSVKKEYIDKLMAQREAKRKPTGVRKQQASTKRTRKRPFPGRRIRRPAANVNDLSFYVRPGVKRFRCQPGVYRCYFPFSLPGA